MSSVLDQVECPQCKYQEADTEYNCRTGEQNTLCRQCGFQEEWRANYDDAGNFREFTHVVNHGAGSVFYRSQ
jgi:hypothetical protein